jgi:hypothetical protein
MGNKKLPWREVAAAVAGGLFVLAWRKRQPVPRLTVAPLPPVDEVVNEPPPVGVEIPLEVLQMIAQMQMTPTQPQPVRDIALHVDPAQGIILIYVYSVFAAAWVRAESPKFGALFYPQTEHAPYVLMVNRVYHPGQVAGWLSSAYGQEGEDERLAPVDSPE